MMITREPIFSRLWVAALLCGVFASPSVAAPPVEDSTGKEWRQLIETTNLSWEEISSVCPTDGQTPCSGSVGDVDLSNWVWASSEQVLALMALTQPILLTSEFSFLSGPEYFAAAAAIVTSGFEYTYESSGTYHQTGGMRGTTSSLTADGIPIRGSAGWGCGPCGGGLGVAEAPGDVTSFDPATGVWLWRTIGSESSLPVGATQVDETCGDSDGDQVDDCADNCSDVPNPDQNDTDGDSCGNACDADYDQDGRVTFADFGAFSAAFGSFEMAKDHTEPVTGEVGASDYGFFTFAFGGVPGPSGTTSGTSACP
jgi:hypothetical protein